MVWLLSVSLIYDESTPRQLGENRSSKAIDWPRPLITEHHTELQRACSVWLAGGKKQVATAQLPGPSASRAEVSPTDGGFPVGRQSEKNQRHPSHPRHYLRSDLDCTAIGLHMHFAGPPLCLIPSFPGAHSRNILSSIGLFVTHIFRNVLSLPRTECLLSRLTNQRTNCLR